MLVYCVYYAEIVFVTYYADNYYYARHNGSSLIFGELIHPLTSLQYGFSYNGLICKP